jgi:hypothetical protein
MEFQSRDAVPLSLDGSSVQAFFWLPLPSGRTTFVTIVAEFARIPVFVPR